MRARVGQAEVLPLELNHAQINAQLGDEGAYTAAVDRFIDRALAAPADSAR